VDEARRRLQPYYLILLAVLLQGLSPVLTKLLMDKDALSASTVVAARYALAVLFLLPFGVRGPDPSSKYGPPRRRDWVALLCVGGFGSAIGTLLFTQALAMAPAGVANALSKTAPIFVAFLAYYALRERVSSLRFTLVFVMVAADVLIGIGEFRAAPAAEVGARLAGDVCALLAGLSRALAEILSKGCLHRFKPSTVALSRFGIGLLVGAVACTAQGKWGQLGTLSPRGWLVLIALGSIGTSISMAIYLKGLAQAQAHVAVSLRLLGSIVTVGLAWAILGERLHPLHFAGIAILLGASYVIVTRAARREIGPPGRPERAPGIALSEPWTPVRARLSLKLKIAALIVAVVFATMFTSSALSLRHTEGVVRREIRVLMAQIAATIAQLRAVPDAPRLTTLEQYIDRVVRQDITSPAYSVRIIFIAVLDRAGHLVAFATNPAQLTLADASGLAYRRGDRRAAQQLVTLALSGQLDRRYDLVTVEAVAELGDREAPLVVMGCRRSLAERAEADVRNRALFLTLTFVLLGVAIAIHVAGTVTRPLERLAVAMRRVRAGDLELAVVPEGNDEIQDLGQAFNEMVEGLRAKELRERAFSAYVARQVADGWGVAKAASAQPDVRKVTGLFVDAGGATWAAAGGGAREALTERVSLVIEAVSRHEGTLEGCRGRWLVAVWGAGGEEQDDALRAAMAAVELSRAVRELGARRAGAGGPPAEWRIGINTAEVPVGALSVAGEGLDRMAKAVAEAWSGGGWEAHLPAAVILVGVETRNEVGEHVVLQEVEASSDEAGARAEPAYLVLGLQGDEPLYGDEEMVAIWGGGRGAAERVLDGNGRQSSRLADGARGGTVPGGGAPSAGPET